MVTTHNIDRASQSVASSHEDALVNLKIARQQLIDTIDCLRRLIANLRPTVLDELGLVTAIEMLCEQNEHISFAIGGHAREIDHAQELALFRTAQEALLNAKRYAKAKHIRTRLSYSKTAVIFEVCDDGIGFEVPPQLQVFASAGHYGLLGIYERVKYLGGELKVDSTFNAGTQIAVTLPV